MTFEQKINTLSYSIYYQLADNDSIKEYMKFYSIAFRNGKGIQDIDMALSKAIRLSKDVSRTEDTFQTFQRFMRTETLKDKRMKRCQDDGYEVRI